MVEGEEKVRTRSLCVLGWYRAPWHSGRILDFMLQFCHCISLRSGLIDIYFDASGVVGDIVSVFWLANWSGAVGDIREELPEPDRR